MKGAVYLLRSESACSLALRFRLALSLCALRYDRVRGRIDTRPKHISKPREAHYGYPMESRKGHLRPDNLQTVFSSHVVNTPLTLHCFQYVSVVKSATARPIQCALKVSAYLLNVPEHGLSEGSSIISTKLVEWPVVESVPARSVVL